MNILTIGNLKKSYNDFTAVGGISLAVEAGEIHGILGPNDAGKSTTMNCILGHLPYEGKITFEGEKGIKEWNKNVGYVPQDLAIYPRAYAYGKYPILLCALRI